MDAGRRAGLASMAGMDEDGMRGMEGYGCERAREVPLGTAACCCQSCQSSLNPATAACVTWVGPGPVFPFIGPMGRQRGDFRGQKCSRQPAITSIAFPIARAAERGMLPEVPGAWGRTPYL